MLEVVRLYFNKVFGKKKKISLFSWLEYEEIQAIR